MKRLIRLGIFSSYFFGTPTGFAQDYSEFVSTFQQIQSIDSTTRTNTWSKLTHSQQVPFVRHDSVVFFFKGDARSVSWMGDFNGWGYDKKFDNKGKRISNTDIWYLKASFPRDARLDYKILINDTDWIIDPYNPHQQWSGVGGGSPNSELHMPEWREDPVLTPRTEVPKGSVTSDLLFTSKVLGYQITYNVYVPANYASLGKLPVIYVTDGYEYMHPKMGNMITILDNLIADKKIKPVAAVFIDHREPINRSNNRRMTELAMNPRYADFITHEFLPFIEKNYPVETTPNSRAILGTSMGGLTAAYLAFSQNAQFGMAGIQSPAFWTKPQIYELCKNPENPTLKVYLSTGTVNDTFRETEKMKEILSATACQFEYKQVNEGHSWGNWRNLIDDVLVSFFGLK